MLTPYVMGLVFANCVAAACVVAAAGALRIADQKNFRRDLDASRSDTNSTFRLRRGSWPTFGHR
jgi:hypothetical protein